MRPMGLLSRTKGPLWMRGFCTAVEDRAFFSSQIHFLQSCYHLVVFPSCCPCICPAGNTFKESLSRCLLPLSVFMSDCSELGSGAYPWTLGLFLLHVQCESSLAVGSVLLSSSTWAPKEIRECPGRLLEQSSCHSSTVGFLSVTSAL